MNKDVRMCCFMEGGATMGRWFSLCGQHRQTQKIPEGMTLQVGEHTATCSECDREPRVADGRKSQKHYRRHT